MSTKAKICYKSMNTSLTMSILAEAESLASLQP